MSGETRTKPQATSQAPQRAQEVAVAAPPRLPYRQAAAQYGITESSWETLVNATFPAAKTPEGVLLAIAYCKLRGLDVFKRPVHIVPMNTKRKTPDGKEVWVTIETIWPGISELRTTAFRTGKYAGCDPATFGDDIAHSWEIQGRDNDDDGGHPNAPQSEKKAAAPKAANVFSMKFPEWCQITVYRLIEGQRVAFPGPRVYWLETYATTSRFNDSPNEMWKDRARGQIEKCAEAAALRKAFPEELGGEYSIDEAPRMVDVTPIDDAPTTRPEAPSGSAADTKIARAARERAEAKTVETTIDHDPKTGEVIEQSASAGKQIETPEMSEALEDALGKLTRMHDPDEIDGARKYLKTSLSPDDFAVWQTSSLQVQQRIAKLKR